MNNFATMSNTNLKSVSGESVSEHYFDVPPTDIPLTISNSESTSTYSTNRIYYYSTNTLLRVS